MNLNFIFSMSMNLHLNSVFSKPMNLNSKIRKIMNGSNPTPKRARIALWSLSRNGRMNIQLNKKKKKKEQIMTAWAKTSSRRRKGLWHLKIRLSGINLKRIKTLAQCWQWLTFRVHHFPLFWSLNSCHWEMVSVSDKSRRKKNMETQRPPLELLPHASLNFDLPKSPYLKN